MARALSKENKIMSIVLKASVREKVGKGPSRRARMSESLPAVVYGLGHKNMPIVVCPRETSKALKGPLRRNVLLNLEIEGDSQKNRIVMVKERQIHPVRRELIHVDFIEVDVKKPVVVSVPVKLFGKSESVVMGGKLDHVLQKMRISCLPSIVPEAIEVDISTLGFGSTHCADVPLPEGIALAEKPRVVILTIKKPRGAAKEEGAEGEKAAAKGKK